MHFDVSLFTEIGSALFNVGRYMFSLLNFDFNGFTVNGLVLLIGIAVVCIVFWFIGRISE